jgi:hypothetical protein
MRREKMAVLEKRPLTSEVLEAQTAFELPDRESLLVTVLIGCVVCTGDITIDVRNVGIAAAICAQVNVINNLAGEQVLTCDVQET